MNPTYCSTYSSPAGELLTLIREDFVIGIYFAGEKHAPTIDTHWLRNDRLFDELHRQLDQYFCGKRQVFELPLRAAGTDFQMRVWTALDSIPYGETWTYQELATNIGNPRASRAVGAASGKNPFSIVVPCHRVIGASSQLTGYAGGLFAKRILLDLEQKFRR